MELRAGVDSNGTGIVGLPEYSWQTAGFLIFQNRAFKQSTTRPDVLSSTRSVSFLTKALPQGLSLPAGSSSASTWHHQNTCQLRYSAGDCSAAELRQPLCMADPLPGETKAPWIFFSQSYPAWQASQGPTWYRLPQDALLRSPTA